MTHRSYLRLLGVIGVCALLVILAVPFAGFSLGSNPAGPQPSGATPAPAEPVFREEFAGDPAAPEAWASANWDVTVHTRGPVDSFDEMQAHHGPDCGPAPASHTISRYDQAVFRCRSHLMTALSAGDYGAIYLTPNQLVDFSAGEAVVRFDMSTLRTSGRDWVDVWISPMDDHLQLPLDSWLPDLQGEPRRSVHIRMDNGVPGTSFRVKVSRDFEVVELEGKPWVGYESFLEASATRRDTFELRISRTHIKFGMPQYNFWWVDTPIEDLGWGQGVVQFGHHSYTPLKDCEGDCAPNTWHWDNVEINPAVPFVILKPDRPAASAADPGPLSFAQPAPAGSRLRFAGIGGALEVSFDGGASWEPARLQDQLRYDPGHFRSYWMPVPAGATQVLFRGQERDDWRTGPWMARSVAIFVPPGGPVAMNE
jgi:hypothetical protein